MDNWKDIKGYEGYYKVSDTGKVRRIERYVKSVNGRGKYERLVKGKIVSVYENKQGYLHLHLSKNGVAKKFYISRLVALAFIPNPNCLYSVDHIDENKKNNNVDNLQWLSLGDNVRKSRSKPVRIINGDKVLEFDSCLLASQYIGCGRNAVSVTARKISPSIYGWEIEYI